MARQTTLYRYITGPDDAAFCHRISELLSRGWVLYGLPTLTFDATSGRVICGQAIIKDVDGPYSPEMKLAEQ
ncbi:DUF1737 domain-containing protein [Bosea vaviloviae]|uniref:DUF1737 domain-containing protein n=1 Tax=Bosea vaviloviae TaxID=1526658 RepID=A0A1D7TVT3_9HYPH|nr:DUF1737 domain-containing protein [Bosea vaviloviae]AOO79228.1 hypothetical protein BHK69_00805 [Bosea vaviloviae]